MKLRNVIFLLTVILANFNGFTQSLNDQCGNAIELCPGITTNVSNSNASASVCPNCEDDFNFCFDPEATIWFSFTTNTLGGDVSVQLSNTTFANNPGQDQELQATIISAVAPCDASTYTQVGSCVVSGAATTNLTAVGLSPNSTYYIVLGGDQNGTGITSPASFITDVMISGTGVDRPTPNLSITQSSTSPCLNENVTFTAQVSACPDSSDYSWYVNGVLTAVTADSVWTSSGFQTGDIVTVSIDCYANCPFTVSIDAQPLAVYTFLLDAGTDIYIDAGVSVQLNGLTTAPVYSWSPSFEMSNPNVLNPIVTPNQTTVYSLTATENGCTQTDQVTVFLNDSLEIPNTFSPNNDGLNETWVIKGIEKFPNNRVSLYTRWGQEIFSVSNYSSSKAWDGLTRSGSKAAEGVYFYVIDLGDGSDLINGTLNLIR